MKNAFVKKRTNRWAPVLFAVMIFSLAFFIFSTDLSAAVREDIDKTYRYEKGSDSTALTAAEIKAALTEKTDLIVLGAGRDVGQTAVSADNFKNYLGYVTANLNAKPSSYSITDDLRASLAAGAAGNSSAAVTLMKKGLFNRTLSALKGQGTKALAYALLTLDANGIADGAITSSDSSISRASLRGALCNAAAALTEKSTLTDADVQSAALIITAMAPYYQNDNDAQVGITSLLSQLALNQNSDGSFRNSCAATAWVLTALSSLKIDPAANDFLSYDVYAGLLTFQNGDGGFGSMQSSSSSSPTTSVARIALVAYQVYQNGGLFFDFSSVTHHDPAKVSPSGGSSSSKKSNGSSSGSSSKRSNNSVSQRSSTASSSNLSNGSSSGGNSAAAGNMAGVTTTQKAEQGTTVLKAVFEKIKGTNDRIAYEGVWNESEKYTITFAGKDIREPKDFNAVITADSANRARILKAASDAEIICFAHQGSFPGKATAQVTVALADGAYHLYYCDPDTGGMELVTNCQVKNSVASFSVEKGGEYFLSKVNLQKEEDPDVFLLEDTVGGIIPAATFKAYQGGTDPLTLSGETDRGIRYEIIFEGADIETPMDFNMIISEETDAWETISRMADNPLVLHFEQDGEIPGKATVIIHANLDNASEQGLYLYDPEVHSASYTGSIEAGNGQFSFELTHCCDYFIAPYDGSDVLFPKNDNWLTIIALILEGILIVAALFGILYRIYGKEGLKKKWAVLTGNSGKGNKIDEEKQKAVENRRDPLTEDGSEDPDGDAKETGKSDAAKEAPAAER